MLLNLFRVFLPSIILKDLEDLEEFSNLKLSILIT